MKIIYQRLIIASIVFCLPVGQIFAQNTVGLLSYDSAKVSPGYNLIYPHNQSTVHLLDKCGRVIHQWTDADNWRPGNTAYLTKEGNLVKTKRENASLNDPIWAGGGGDIIEIRTWDNELITSFAQNDSLYRLHHDIEPMPNGNILMIVWEYQSYEDAVQAGRDPGKLPQQELWPEAVWEWNPELDSIVWKWHMWDHLIQDYDASKDNYGVVADHPELIDINYDEHDGHPDWIHMNAINYNPVLDQIILSAPYFNEVWVIDHATTTEEAAASTGGLAGKGGDLLYRFGNPAAYGQGTIEDRQLVFQHDCKWVNPDAMPGDADFGLFSTFNNRAGDYYSPMVIWNPLNEDQTDYEFSDHKFGPDGFTREVYHPDSLSICVSTGLSSAEHLPNGNVLIMAGRFGFAYEMTPDDELVWEYRIPLKAGAPVSQGTDLGLNNNITFRMNRYPVDFPGFIGKDLTPGDFFELNPNPETCPGTIVDVDSEILELKEASIFPNPTRNILNISLSQKAVWQLYNGRGQLLNSWNLAEGNHQLDVSGFPKGMYFLRSKAQAVRIVIQ